MATPAEDLITARTQLLTQLILAVANPKPNYSIEGQSVSHGDFLEMLLRSLKALEELLSIYDPYWYESVAT